MERDGERECSMHSQRTWPFSENLAHLTLPPPPPRQLGLLSSVLSDEKKKNAYLEMGVVHKPQEAVQPMTPKMGVSGSPRGGSDPASQNVLVSQGSPARISEVPVGCSVHGAICVFLLDHSFLLVFLFFVCFDILHLFVFTTLIVSVFIVSVRKSPVKGRKS